MRRCILGGDKICLAHINMSPPSCEYSLEVYTQVWGNQLWGEDFLTEDEKRHDFHSMREPNHDLYGFLKVRNLTK